MAVTTLSHGSAALDEAIQQVRPDKLVREGGCGYKALMVAQGLFVVKKEGKRKSGTEYFFRQS